MINDMKASENEETDTLHFLSRACKQPYERADVSFQVVRDD